MNRLDSSSKSKSIYLSIQFPLTDLRPLLGLETLPFPEWTKSPDENEFVHYFGEVRRRLRGVPANTPWQDELYYATARRAISFPRLEKKQLGRFQSAQGGCRSLYHDGDKGVVIRVEAGISLKLKKSVFLDDNDYRAILNDFLELSTDIAQAKSHSSQDSHISERVRLLVHRPLMLAGPQLASLYLNASTKLGNLTNEDTVKDGEPLVFILYRGGEIKELTERSRLVDPAKVNNAKVSYTVYESNKRLVGVWFIDSDSASGDALRRLRIGLSRIHAERQAMLRVLQQFQVSRLVKNSSINDFIEKRLQWLSESRQYGIDTTVIQDITNIYDLFSPRDDLEYLEERIAEFRGRRSSHGKYLGFPNQRKGVFICYSHRDARIQQQLSEFLKPLNANYFDDTKIKPGALWEDEIRRELKSCKVAVLLVSQYFLNSDYIQKVEIPMLLDAAENEGAVVLPLFVSPASSHDIEPFTRYKSVSDKNTPRKTLRQVEPVERMTVFQSLRDYIDNLLGIERAS
jgi:hypothetical protein